MVTPFAQRPTWAEINLDNLAFNFHSSKRFIGSVDYMAVIKADGYGHSAIECAKRLEKEGVDWFGVALPEEGFELRKAGIDKPILCLGGFWDGQEGDLIADEIVPVIFRPEQANSLNAFAKSLGKTVPVHVKIDTGMGRIGVPHNELEDFARRIADLHNLRVEGVMTHFATADDLSQNEFTNLQIKLFKSAIDVLERFGISPKYRDLANSPAAVAHPDSRGNLVRLGGILYGLGGDVLPKDIEKPSLKPVLSLHSAIAQLKVIPQGTSLGYNRSFTTERESLIATVPIGYHDGLPRVLSNHGRMIVNSQFAPIVGRISMDWTILDVTEIDGVRIGDPVTIIGSQGDSRILAEEIAFHAKTISYEITCGIDRRVPRVFVEANAE